MNWTDGGHFLTLTSLTWDNVTNRGTIDYIDPWTGMWGISNIWRAGTRAIETDYVSGAFISMAVSESPIPEPATLVIWSLLSALVVGFGWWRRRG